MRKALVFASACITATPLLVISAETRAEGFIDDASLTGGIYYWQRQRDRKNLDPGSDGEYQNNLHHSTANGSLDFKSGYAADIAGLDLGVYGAAELASSGPAAPDEIGFSKAKTRWDERWSGDKGGLSFYQAAVKLKHHGWWMRGGYLQPAGQTLLAPHWSFLPGTYRGAEIGVSEDYGDSGAFSLSWLWADAYKAPWYQHLYRFRQADGHSEIAWLHSLGAKYDFKNNLMLEGAFGQSASYIDQYFAKVSYGFPLAGNDLRTSYQFYGARDKQQGGAGNLNDIYDGLAWLQALTLGYRHGPFDFRLEGSWVKAQGNQGYFLQRMTPGYASSNGRLDIWWDARSDWNANGEKALFAGVLYDLKGWQLPDWQLGGSLAWGWDARPATSPQWDQNQRLKESAWSVDLLYTIPQGGAKGTRFKLHYTQYNNHSTLPSYSGGYGNIFQDEKDVKFIVMAPFTIF
ncbi:chitoporin ChiP [Pantoea sp. B65]|uniref:chitoporin ChiP n=1 Tax=Pantoea sp. B65 TaxID=2813359 RepID=UPI0039B6329C